MWQRARWGDDAAAVQRAFGARAIRLEPPLEFGDSTAPVALRGETIGGHRFVVYFQMDKGGGGLRRIHFERPRQGATLGVFRDTIAALETEYGKPTQTCDVPRQDATANQAALVRIWRRDAGTVRAVFRDTTLGAGEGCLAEERSGTSACGAKAQLFVQVGRGADAPGCG